MITEIGHFALILALLVATVQATVPLVGAARGERRWMATAPAAATLQVLLVGIAFLALTRAYVVSDFSVLNVVRNSHSAKPLLYKLSGVWGNHEGSMLLWTLILALFGAAVAWFGRRLPVTLQARVLAVQAMIAVGFLLFVLATSNPFERVDPAPADGLGLNPMLQDPGLAFHPPFLYLGYVGFSIAFSFAVAALIEGRVDPAWGRWVRPWTLAAWAFLTLGIALGSWWAYYTLGWGGWWFWDPVENASLMPWLAGTALLHSAIVVEKRDALKSWTILLAIITFSLSLIGTFLVRSGVLTSVHAFAVDPARGAFILLLLALAVGGSLLLFGLRAPVLRPGGVFAAVSREGALVVNNLLLATATATVFVGTLYPLFLDVLGAGKVSVGPPYFHATFVPLMLPLLALMAVGPLLAWRRGDGGRALVRLLPALAAALAAGAITAAVVAPRPLLALVGVALAVWLVGGALLELGARISLFRLPIGQSLHRALHLPRAALGMTLAHVGVGIAIAGMTGASAWTSEAILVLRAGQSVELAGYQVTLLRMEQVDGPNYVAERGVFVVTRADREVATLRPERRRFDVNGRVITHTAIHTTGIADLYLALGDAGTDPAAGTTVRLYHNPLVPLIWYGCLIMALGAGVSLCDRRYRIGLPARPIS